MDDTRVLVAASRAIRSVARADPSRGGCVLARSTRRGVAASGSAELPLGAANIRNGFLSQYRHGAATTSGRAGGHRAAGNLSQLGRSWLQSGALVAAIAGSLPACRVRISRDERRPGCGARECGPDGIVVRLEGPATLSLPDAPRLTRSLSPRRRRSHVRYRSVSQAFEGHFLPGTLRADERPQELVIQRMPRLVAAEFTDQAVPQQV
jgi:hypothetical protein